MPPAKGTRSQAPEGRATSGATSSAGWLPCFCLRPTDRGNDPMPAQNPLAQFVSDDDGYLRWLRRNPSGYVVNSHRTPGPEYLVLHRASCRWINTGVPNNWTTTGYIKTCSPDVTALAEWAGREVGGA